MHISGIIAEYDPFHNGHAYHIAKTRALGTDAVVVALGGEFTQRGDPAWCSKYLRAQCAVMCGADLVVEIPLPYAVGSAERFAEGGIKVLSGLGCIDTLSFGSESGNTELIKRFADLEDSEKYINLVKEEMKKGIAVPAARQNAAEMISTDFSEIFNNPNDILAAEYVKFIKRENVSINPVAVKRYGAGHGEDVSYKSGIASASYLRTFDNPEDIVQFIPKEVYDLILKEYADGKLPTDMKKYETAVLSILRTRSLDEIRKVPDAEKEGLYNRVYDSIKNSSSLDELYDNIKTKRYTMTRVKRVVTGTLLGLDNDVIKKAGVPYIRVLAMNEKGAEILKTASETATIPIGSSLKNLSKMSPEALYMADIESRAEDIWQLCRRKPGLCGIAYTEKIIKV